MHLENLLSAMHWINEALTPGSMFGYVITSHTVMTHDQPPLILVYPDNEHLTRLHFVQLLVRIAN